MRAVLLLALLLAAIPGWAEARRCAARDLADADRCNRSSPAAQTVFDREMRGIAPPAPDPVAPPAWLDTDLLETQLFGLEEGASRGAPDFWPVPGWPEPDAFLMVAKRPDGPAAVLLRFVSPTAEARPEVRIIARMDAMPEDAACAPPRGGDTSRNSPYELVPESPAVMPLRAGTTVLRFRLAASEGYAGGGASFEAVMLGVVDNGSVRPIACIEVHGYQMFAGEWNRDGTRQHEIAEDEWHLSLGRPGPDGYRDIVARPAGRGAAVIYRWNPAARTYVIAPKAR